MVALHGQDAWDKSCSRVSQRTRQVSFRAHVEEVQIYQRASVRQSSGSLKMVDERVQAAPWLLQEAGCLDLVREGVLQPPRLARRAASRVAVLACSLLRCVRAPTKPGCRDCVGWWTPRAVSGTIEEQGKKEQGCRDGVGWWTPRAVSGTIEEQGKKEQGCRDGVGWWTPRAVSGTIEEQGKKEQNAFGRNCSCVLQLTQNMQIIGAQNRTALV
ncbi:hypothetical protein NDU88_005656 [Pleurodeles waltl]|uniref:Uncharacterized protein n=1 Tax=Pleurodeles waltl TaxID=8319 RepID=A0AAV7X1A9_PLEWA|nr:hypothetical protein NDU88_005656 [Pleurodeles waltl]